MVIPDKPTEEKPLFWCPRCKEFTTCPRGSCEAEKVGIIKTEYIININNDNIIQQFKET